MKKDLTTECARVWHDAYSLQGEGSILTSTYHVSDPGLYFGFGDVFIEFDDAPDVNTQQVYWHIPVFFNVSNVWDTCKKVILFKGE